MGGVLSLFLRPFARLRWIALAGLSVVVRLGTAQELDLRPLPLPQSEFLTSPSIASPPSSDTEEKQDPRPKRTHEAVQKGTSNDRILWTIPNFLAMEKREKYSAAYSRTKVQGHCTGSRALFRRRSCTRTRATTNWATAVSGDGALTPLSARHALRFLSTARELRTCRCG